MHLNGSSFINCMLTVLKIIWLPHSNQGFYLFTQRSYLELRETIIGLIISIKEMINTVVFLDLKKGVWHLWSWYSVIKLSSYGIRGNSLNWFKSYLDNRRQNCFINGSLYYYLLVSVYPRELFWVHCCSWSILMTYRTVCEVRSLGRIQMVRILHSQVMMLPL